MRTSVSIRSINVVKSLISTGVAFTKPCQRPFERAGVDTLLSQGETKKNIAGCAQLFAHSKNSDAGEKFNPLSNYLLR